MGFKYAVAIEAEVPHPCVKLGSGYAAVLKKYRMLL